MQTIVPLPESIRGKIGQNTHPGLMLDKFVESWDPAAGSGKLSERVQKPAVEKVVRLSQQPPAGLDFAALARRRTAVLAAFAADCFRATTAGPLTLHLARASALENAGICLHPIYGFVYLPGTGLKGMAHAYACEVWLPAQGESGRDQAWLQIVKVFGWAPSPGLRELAKRWQVKVPDDAQAGEIVFHDAWPEGWPRLAVDILNNHHTSYYQDGEPAGDWDAPVPVYFLAVPPGQTFSFALGKRRTDVPDESQDLARQWLMGALLHEGAGAKTATGYGCFQLDHESIGTIVCDGVSATWSGACQAGNRFDFECKLRLETPAFLGGSNPYDLATARHDCTLRGATLRGLLRWWWRTMHAGHVDVETLRRMEAAVWGDTQQGGAVRMALVPDGEIRPVLYDKRAIQQANHLPQPGDRKTTQGLWYHSYGMDESKGRRHYVPADACWKLRLTSRDAPVVAERDNRGRVVREETLPGAVLLEQARAAVWLFCRFAGAGSKSRKGFGSFAVPEELRQWTKKDVDEAAKKFRIAWHEHKLGLLAGEAGSPSMGCLDDERLHFDLETPWTNYWFALDRAGAAAQRFAQRYKHNVEKKALGLPRRVQPPLSGKFRAGRNAEKSDRHASPVHFHLYRGPSGAYHIRVTAFPSPELPTLEKSRKFLEEYMAELRQALQAEFRQHSASGRSAALNPQGDGHEMGSPGTTASRKGPVLPKPGDRVEAVLLEEVTNRGGRKASHSASGLTGPIQNSADVPAEKMPGDIVSLLVAYASPQQIAFRYPTPADEKRTQKPRGKPGGKHPKR
ncbi:MAG: type III-B CRISPR module RAMP protein Cmr6 [Candidatus Anammoximicrobium sp.]|nr:type III-B CRISPR module RAMP protein Cmr6 [Candidatus Anammoximicrobium sp.]